MPPVGHVALGELLRRVQQDLRAHQFRMQGRQRAGILELVAESIGAAGLIERAAAPDPAGEVLVEQPAVDHQIDFRQRRFDFQTAEHPFPERVGAGGTHGIGLAVAGEQARFIRSGHDFTQADDDFNLRAGRQAEGNPAGKAGVMPEAAGIFPSTVA